MAPMAAENNGEWSGNQDHTGGLSYSPGDFPTPPSSTSQSFPSESNGLGVPPSNISQNPSPPSSVTSRSQANDPLSDPNSEAYKRMEKLLGRHYGVLKSYLNSLEAAAAQGQQHPEDQDTDQDQNPNNRARDKLLRLPRALFIELSTDVNDELLRRRAVASPIPGRPDAPPSLPPRKQYHEKRNNARGKLCRLQFERFKDLVTDVCCELERRFPHFAEAHGSRRSSPAPSVRYGSGANGFGRPESNGYAGSRSSSRGPYTPGGLYSGRFPARQGSLSAISMSSGLGINGNTILENAPYQKSFHNNTVVPNKSTLVEDEEEGDRYGYGDDNYSNRRSGRSDAFALDKVLDSRRQTAATMVDPEQEKKLAEAEEKISSLNTRLEEVEASLREKDEEMAALQQSKDDDANAFKSERSEWVVERNEWESEKSSMEAEKRILQEELSAAQELKDELQARLEDAENQYQAAQRELEDVRRESFSKSEADNDWQVRFEDLNREHESLKVEFQQQQEVTEQVRQQATAFLEEMRAMTQGHDSSSARAENLEREVHRLEEELKNWKNRYAKTKTQLKHLRSSSIGLPGHIQDADSIIKENDLTDPDGVIKDVHITKFQMAIDELLRIARSTQPELVLEQMKAVIVAIHHIIEDLANAPDQNPADSPRSTPSRNKLKTRVSAMANNLITASRNFAHSHGLSPVSLLDAAASHLTSAVIELARVVKIRATSEHELVDDEQEIMDCTVPTGSSGYFSVSPSHTRYSEDESLYSGISSPKSQRSRSYISHTKSPSSNQARVASSRLDYDAYMPEGELKELGTYLEDQTEGLIKAIQSLVTSIRTGDDFSDVRPNIDDISNLVENVVSRTQAALDKPDANPKLKRRVSPVIQNLSQWRENLLNTGLEGDRTGPEDFRDVTKKLPPIAFKIAHETKELVQRIDQIEDVDDEEEEDDFR
ncbi:component of the polarisome [Myotisia sp. PD_48]|nr:component of the polarisome [Myotisia sp. PD_48]